MDFIAMLSCCNQDGMHIDSAEDIHEVGVLTSYLSTAANFDEAFLGTIRCYKLY
jgi:hypothetical protein